MEKLRIPAGAGYQYKSPGTSMPVFTEQALHVAFAVNVTTTTVDHAEGDHDDMVTWDREEVYTPTPDPESEWFPQVVAENLETGGYDVFWFNGETWECIENEFISFEEVKNCYSFKRKK